jgi:hypothetical protein
MADDFPVQGDDLKKIVKKSRSMPIAFGFNPGTADDDDEYLAAHARKKPEILGKLALKEGAGTKAAFGTFEIVDSELHLTCFRTLPQLAKKFKLYLKRFKITLNVVVMDPDGNVIDTDIETLTEWVEGEDDGVVAEDVAEETADSDDALDAIADAPDPALDPGELAVRLKAIQPELAKVPANVAERVNAGFTGAVALIRGGRLAEAESAISKLEMVLARLAMAAKAEPAAPATPAPDPRLPKLREAVDKLRSAVGPLPGGEALMTRLAEATSRIDTGEAEAAMGILREVQTAVAKMQADREKWAKAEAMVAPQIAAALQARNVADPDGLRTRWGYVMGLAGDGAFDKALAALPGIVAMLKAPAVVAEVAAGTAAFQKSRILWLGTRDRMMAEARKLADAIVAQSADDADAAEIAEAAGEILAEVGQIDERLQDALDRITVTPEGAARDGLKREAAAIVAEYQASLGQGVFAMIDRNPFAAVSVTARARAALGQVAKTLAA